MHSICTVNHTAHISYPLFCSVNQVFFSPIYGWGDWGQNSLEQNWEKQVGTITRSRWLAHSPGNPRFSVLTLNRKFLQLQVTFTSGFLTSVVFLCVWRKQLFEVQMVYQTFPVHRWQNRGPKKSHHAQDLPLPGPFKTHEMFWVDIALSHPPLSITNSMDMNLSKLQERVKDRRA